MSSLLQASLSVMKKLPQRCLVIPLSALHVDALCTEKMPVYFYCALSSLPSQGEKNSRRWPVEHSLVPPQTLMETLAPAFLKAGFSLEVVLDSAAALTCNKIPCNSWDWQS